MDSSSFSILSEKRPFSHLSSKSNGAHNPSSNKNPKTSPPPVVMFPGQTAFRLLCPSDRSGAVIGHAGCVVRLIRQQTGALIRLEDQIPGCAERVVLVVGSAVENSTLLHGEMESSAAVSKAQDALLKVFEKVLEAEKVAEGTAMNCRLLALKKQVGGVIGKGGKIVERIRGESGAKIRVLKAEEMPACASTSDDSLIQIEGDVSSVKKALLSVSRRLQDNPPQDNFGAVTNKPVAAPQATDGVSSRSSFLDTAHSPGLLVSDSKRNSFFDISAPTTSLYMGNFDSYHPSLYHSSASGPRDIDSPGKRKDQQDIRFRLVCSNDRIGGIIGTGGSIIQALENETGASIAISPTTAGSEERVITISALEIPASKFSGAQDAAIHVYTRSAGSLEKGTDVDLDNNGASVRLLVPSKQVGCLLGKGGKIMAEMRQATGARIQIFRQGEVPKCASEDDELVQISGSYKSTLNALLLVTSKLRENMFSTKLANSEAGLKTSQLPEISSHSRFIEQKSAPLPSIGLYGNLDFSRGLTAGLDRLSLPNVDQVELPREFDYTPSSRLWDSQVIGSSLRSPLGVERELPTLRGGTEYGRSDAKSVVVTSTTLELAVSKDALESVYGQNGNNLIKIRQISGAKVTVHDPIPGSKVTVIISGTPDQTQTAQTLLQAYILSSPSQRR